LSDSSWKYTSETRIQDHSAKYYEHERYRGNGLKYCIYTIEKFGELNGKICDVGCGTGILSRLYPTKDITGIDISAGMLQFHLGNHVQGSVCDMPFNDHEFDMVIGRSILHHLPNPQKALFEFRRVLKPGGKLLLWETNKSWLATLVRRFTQHGDRFSEYHTAFKSLPNMVSCLFKVTNVSYEGFLAYPLFGFPDIINFNLPKFMLNPIVFIDELLSKTPVSKHVSFAVRIISEK